jgi:hypothetical protein
VYSFLGRRAFPNLVMCKKCPGIGLLLLSTRRMVMPWIALHATGTRVRPKDASKSGMLAFTGFSEKLCPLPVCSLLAVCIH